MTLDSGVQTNDQDQTSSAANATSEPPKSHPQGEYHTYTADQLEIADDNVRDGTDRKTKKRTVDQGIKELAALILSQGLLQNLIGFHSNKKSKKIKVQICGGGRRLTAICWLIAEGKLPADFPIVVLVCEEKNALLLSLAENSGREEMTVANQLKAFKTAVDAGKPIDEISVEFGVDVLTIKRRLKLAAIEPSIFSEYEQGNVTLETITPLTLTDDHKLQLQVWNSLGQHNKNAHAIRRLLTTNKVNGNTDPVAQYVTIDAYIAAGGNVEKDLFSESVYLTDPALLESLASSKLETDAAELKTEGWAWIDLITRINSVDLHSYESAPTIRIALTDEQRAERELLAQESSSADDAFWDYQRENEDEDGDVDESADKYIELDKNRENAEKKLEVFDDQFVITDPIAKPFCGAMAIITVRGTLEISRGIIRPDDKKKYKQAIAKEITENPERAAELRGNEKPKSEHSERLTRQLTAHRTAALQVLTSANQDVALVALTHKLAIEIFTDYNTPNSGTALRLSIDPPHLEREGEDVKESLALSEMVEKHSKWKQLLPIGNKGQTLFAWLLQQEKTLVMELMSFCAAYTINTVQGDDTQYIENTELAQAVGLDMADFWEPTRETYLAQVKKDKVVSIVASVVSESAALPMASMPKSELCGAAEKALAGSRWLPNILKTPPKEVV